MGIVSFFGGCMRRNAMPLYRLIQGYINQHNKINSIYVIDYMGGSFKEYISSHSMHDKLSLLKMGLDDYSSHTVDTIYMRILNYPELKYRQKINPRKNTIIGGRLKEEEIEFSPKSILKKGIIINKKYIESSVFYFYHGITEMPDWVKDYINDGDFLDIGAYVGESALALYKFNYKRIYSLEMSKYSIERYEKTMSKNNIYKDKYTILNYAVSSSNEGNISFADSGSAGLSIKKENITKNPLVEVPVRNIDFLVNEYGIKPVFIKMDIEGAAMDCILGGLKSIKKFRPVLSIAIYHNPVEFFEIKPLLSKELTNYTFMIRKLENRCYNNMCHAETTLLAFPNFK